MTRYRVESERERRVLVTFFIVGLVAGGCDISHIVGSVDGAAVSGARSMGGHGGQSFFIVDAGFPGDVMSLDAIESWTGYLENYQFASGSDSVRLSFATDPTGVVVGTITFGTGAAPPSATDPNDTYPPGASQVLPDTIVEGFPYTIAMGTLAGSRLRFTIWRTELWSGWCALQTPISGNPSCLPYGAEIQIDAAGCFYQNPLTGPPGPISCSKVTLCTRGVCVCTDAACMASFEFGGVEFDVALSGTAGSGNAATIGGDIRNVRLTKDP